MNTIKINGGGPLAGKTFYAIRDKGHPCVNGNCLLILDEMPFPGDNAIGLHFSIQTGYLSNEAGCESELLKVDPSDLAKLWF